MPANDHSKMHAKRVETETYQCSVPELHKLNSCEHLKKEHGCTECQVEFEAFGPAFFKQESSSLQSSKKDDRTDLLDKRLLDESKIKGECLVASHGMLINCDNTSP